jgi:hypothetical protein
LAETPFNIAPAEIYFNEFFYPGLLSDILGGQLPEGYTKHRRERSPSPVLKLELARPNRSPLKASGRAHGQPETEDQ